MGLVSNSQNKKYTTYRVSSNETISSIARKLQVTPYDLFKLNPDAKNGIHVDEVLIVPNRDFNTSESKIKTFVKEKKNLIIKDSIIDGFLYHTVKSKETIYSLSSKYAISKRKVRKLNNLDKNGIKIGQVLKFPTKLPNCYTQNLINKVKENTDKYIFYTIKENDTFYTLTRTYNVTEEVLINNNPILKNGLKSDVIIKIPKKQNIRVNELDNTIVTDSLHIPKHKIHQVLEREGFFRLHQLYGVSEEEVRAINPLLISDLKKGMLIKIPLKNELLESEKQTFILHQVQEQEGFFRLSQLYGFSEEEIRTINPEIIDGLKVGMLIKIPQKQTHFVFELPKYLTHIVKEQDNFFQLEQLYRVATEELIKVNPILSEGLKIGMEIKVPVKKDDEFIEKDIQGNSLNIVMLIPFMADKDVVLRKSNKNSRLSKVTDFYLGSLIALDSIKKKGLSVHVKVFDTKQSDFMVNKILNSNSFDNIDAVIAPISFKQLKEVSLKLTNKNIPVISPISSIDCSEIANSVQNVPTVRIKEYKILHHIFQHYNNQNIIIVADEKNSDPKKNRFNIDLIKTNLAKHDSIKLDSISVIRMNEGYIKHKLFENSIKEDVENWVILASNLGLTASITVENLAVFPEKIKINLFSLEQPKNLHAANSDYKIKNAYLNKLNFLYPATFFIDNNREALITFNKQYQLKYGCSPTDFSYKGFDTTYDVLLRLANNKDTAFQGKTNRLITPFDYKQTASSSYTNFGVYLVRYVNYQLQVAE